VWQGNVKIYKDEAFNVLTCKLLSVVPKDVQRLNFPSGSGGGVIDARQALELQTIDDGVGDISYQNIFKHYQSRWRNTFV